MIHVDFIGAWQWQWPELSVVLNVSHQARDIFYAHRQIGRSAHERGGQLFVGIDEVGTFWLYATPPHMRDRSGPTWLELDGHRCKEEIISANAMSLRLIGYWHTHPQDIPALSSQDIASLATFSFRNKGVLENPVAVIVGRSRQNSGIRAWSHRSPLRQLLAEHIEFKATDAVSQS